MRVAVSLLALLLLVACSGELDGAGPEACPVVDAGATAADPCLETDRSIVLCLRGGFAFDWTAAECNALPKKRIAGGNVGERRNEIGCVRASYQDVSIVCCGPQ